MVGSAAMVTAEPVETAPRPLLARLLVARLRAVSAAMVAAVWPAEVAVEVEAGHEGGAAEELPGGGLAAAAPGLELLGEADGLDAVEVDAPVGSLPELQHVVHTNFCDLGFALDSAGKRLIVLSCLDNLGKGAAGQAVQNFNGMYGYPETAGLI